MLLICTFSYKDCVVPPQKRESSEVMKAVFVHGNLINYHERNRFFFNELKFNMEYNFSKANSSEVIACNLGRLSSLQEGSVSESRLT